MKIAVGMSGGVDSSLAAVLLREAGHEVIGLTAWLWNCSRPVPAARACCGSLETLRRAREAAEAARIRHEVVNLSEEFEREVVLPSLSALAQGLTPNPCVLCNARVRFPSLLKAARALGAEMLATGHYAKLERNGYVKLLRGSDPVHDQSYFLFLVSREVLRQTTFPLGALTKARTRELLSAKEHPAAKTPSSQDLCFAGAGHLSEILAERNARGELDARCVLEAGPVVDLEGRVLGQHKGLAHYTIGQRKGIGVATGKALYVVELRPSTRELVVGPEEALGRRSFYVEDVTLAESFTHRELEALVQIRYRTPPQPGRIRFLDGGRVEVILERAARAVAPGQAAVFYHGDEVIGGGWIAPN